MTHTATIIPFRRDPKEAVQAAERPLEAWKRETLLGTDDHAFICDRGDLRFLVDLEYVKVAPQNPMAGGYRCFYRIEDGTYSGRWIEAKRVYTDHDGIRFHAHGKWANGTAYSATGLTAADLARGGVPTFPSLRLAYEAGEANRHG